MGLVYKLQCIDLYGFHVGRYTSPVDRMGGGILPKCWKIPLSELNSNLPVSSLWVAQRKRWVCERAKLTGVLLLFRNA